MTRSLPLLSTAALALLVLAACGSTEPTTPAASADPPAPETSTDEASAPGVPAGEARATDGPQVGDTYTESVLGVEGPVTFSMTYIPGGTFVMGSPEGEADRDADEGPQRTVSVEPFWMGTHEVTYDAFALFRFRERDADTTGFDGYEYVADAAARPSPPYEDPAHGMGNTGYPAVGMTQWGALQYAKWLYEKTGHFYRLPTEAEWEYACRAGTTTAYPFGDDPAELDAYAWHYGNSDETFHPVGQKKPNPWGLYDMMGNVSEWTMDQYAEDFYASIDDGAEAPWATPTSLHPRTVRGGAYDDDPEVLRCAERIESSLAWKRRDPQIPKSYWWNTDSPFVGFRLVRPAKEMTHEEIMDYYATVLNE